MLDWLTGSAPDDESSDENNVGPDDDAPATPAPLFALRAFQHAIYGTPKPSAKGLKPSQKAHRKSLNLKAELPRSEVGNGLKDGPKRVHEMPGSPSKPPGILLTPGTGGNRRKTVSFGSYADRSRDREVANSLLPETPKDVPGRFPAPGQLGGTADKQSLAQRVSNSEEQNPKSTIGKKANSSKESERGQDITIDMNLPRSSSGQYWKSEFESFSNKSSVEVRKLVKKEQLAKKFAKHRDDEALQLKVLLQKERQRIAQLEEQVASYVQQLSIAVDGHPGSKPVRSEEGEMTSHKKEITELHIALQLADTKIQMREDELKSVQSSLNEKSKEIQTLERENKKLRENLEGFKRSTVLENTTALQHAPSSDIWADVEELPHVRKSRVSKSSTLASRSPLRPRSRNIVPEPEKQPCQNAANLGASEDWKEVFRKRVENNSSMPSARREAALKRIEEKRNKRLMNNT